MMMMWLKIYTYVKDKKKIITCFKEISKLGNVYQYYTITVFVDIIHINYKLNM